MFHVGGEDIYFRKKNIFIVFWVCFFFCIFMFGIFWFCSRGNLNMFKSFPGVSRMWCEIGIDGV